MRTSRVRFRWTPLNFLCFFFVVIPDVVRGNERFKRAMKERLPEWYRQLVLEDVGIWSIKG